MSLYALFQSQARLCEQTEFVKVYQCESDGKSYKIVVTKQRANSHTVIHCENNRILWEQVPLFPRFTGRNYGEKVPIYKAVPEKSSVTVFTVKGKPNGFVGLDDGVFRCADNFDERCINVMSCRRFRKM